jgi:hypothetical protein
LKKSVTVEFMFWHFLNFLTLLLVGFSENLYVDILIVQ